MRERWHELSELLKMVTCQVTGHFVTLQLKLTLIKCLGFKRCILNLLKPLQPKHMFPYELMKDIDA